MARMPRITGRELLRALRRAGWVVNSQEGSHVQLVHPEHTGKVTVPGHSGRTLKIGTVASILEQAGLTVEELRELL